MAETTNKIKEIKVGTTTYAIEDQNAVHDASINPTNKEIIIEGNKVTFTLSGTSLTITFGTVA